MSSTLVARDITKSFGATVVLDGVSLTLGPGSRVAIVGPNGIGKSTLLRILAGIEAPDRGSVTTMPSTLTVGYLPQEPDARPGERVADHLARRTGVAAADAALVAASEALAGGGGADAYDVALARYLALGGADLDSRAGAVLADLGLDGRITGEDVAHLSGGQAARVSLAAILLSRFDVLLLDEPTNNLDVDGLERLERFVTTTSAAVAVVSHDRAFLDHTVDRVVELDEGTRRATDFGGGWAAYLSARETARRQQYEAHERYVDEKTRLTAQMHQQKAWAEGGVMRASKKATDRDKFIRHNKLEGAQNLSVKAKLLERRLERLEPEDKPWEGWELRLTLPALEKIGDVTARLDRAVARRGAFRLGPVDLEIGGGERVAIVGPNGAGKTTLLDVLLGRQPLESGARWMGPGVVVGELEQARTEFLGDAPLLDVFVRRSGLLPGEARSLLAKLDLGAGDVERTAATLSPGERTRASLGLLWAGGVSCLVLDEPTNHLDLPAIEQLEAALRDYAGTLLLVTHDRRLLEAVPVSRTVRVDAGQVTAA